MWHKLWCFHKTECLLHPPPWKASKEIYIHKKQSHLFDTDGNSFLLTVVIYSKVTSKFVLWMSFFFLVSCTEKKKHQCKNHSNCWFCFWDMKQMTAEYTGLVLAFFLNRNKIQGIRFLSISSKLQLRPEIPTALTWLVREILFTVFLKESVICLAKV